MESEFRVLARLKHRAEIGGCWRGWNVEPGLGVLARLQCVAEIRGSLRGYREYWRRLKVVPGLEGVGEVGRC